MRQTLLDTLAGMLAPVPIPSAVVVGGRFRSVNPAFLRLGGWSHDRLLGAPVDRIFAAGEVLALPPAGTDRAVEAQCRIAREDGSEAVAMLSASPLTAVGAAAAVLLQAVEITQQREQLAALARSRQALEEFSFDVSHDLRSPMTTVQGFASLLHEALDRLEPDQVRDAAERIHRASRRMQTILEDLQDSAQAITGRGVRSSTTWDQVAMWIEDALGVAVEAVGGRLDVDVPNGLVDVDLGALRQVLANLVDNAVAYRDPDRPLVVRVVAAASDTAVQLTVTDNGRGIPAGQHEDVFERGVRLHPDVDGHGTGLARCRRLVTQLGGTLTARPVDRGARFELWLPTVPGLAAAATAEPHRPPPRRALLVADPERAGVLLPRLHDGTRLDVVATAAGARAARQEVRQSTFDLVLVDGLHRGLRRVVAELRAAAPGLVVLALAPRNGEVHRLPVGSPGAVIYIDDGETLVDLTEVVLFAEQTSRSTAKAD